jgi:predicted RNA-binding Zn-ribbon protein involved in translation (DUF1610 family)
MVTPAPRVCSDGAVQDDDTQMEMSCPRCGETVQERFYGPCERCRTALRAGMRGEVRDTEAAGYEPKMHVTPNAVALKE